MKAKPPSKKARIENPPPTADLVEAKLKRESGNVSPSSTSSMSSLLSLSGTATPSIATPSSSGAAKQGPSTPDTPSTAPSMKPSAASTSAMLSMRPVYPVFQLPDLSDVKSFPRLSAMLQKNVPVEPLTMEDIDILQGELETLWSNVSIRTRNLKAEQGNLQTLPSSVSSVLGEHYDPHHQEKINAVATIIDSGHGTRTSVSAAAKLLNVVANQSVGSPGVAVSPSGPPTPGSSSKKSGNSVKQDRPKKKLKGDGSTSVKPVGKKGEKLARATQNRSHSISSDLGLEGLHKPEAPSQFWEFVDSSCQELTEENVAGLHELIEEHGTLPENIMNIPPLGTHFRDDPETVVSK